jgi:hypothetical protein
VSTRVFDFLCHNGHRVERFVESDIVEHECECGAMGHRQIATPRVQLEGITGAFPGAADAWERRRASHMAKEAKNMQEHGSYE